MQTSNFKKLDSNDPRIWDLNMRIITRQVIKSFHVLLERPCSCVHESKYCKSQKLSFCSSQFDSWVLSQVELLSFVTFWVLSQIKYLSFVTIWVLIFVTILFFYGFVTNWTFGFYKQLLLCSVWTNKYYIGRIRRKNTAAKMAKLQTILDNQITPKVYYTAY